MARLLSTWINGFIGSAKTTGNYTTNAFGKKIPEMEEQFVSDFMGEGWKISKSKEGKYTLEIDSVKIRESLIAHELIINQIRAIAGALGISQACGKVKKVTTNDIYYFLNLEGEPTHGYGGFIANDFIRCQRWTGEGLKGYWVKVESVVNHEDGEGAWLCIRKSEFTGAIVAESDNNTADHVNTDTSAMNTPAVGDDIVQYGNATNTARQSAIYIHANESGDPAMDMLTGINTKSFEGCLAARLGGNLPEGGGFGLYAKNGRIISQTNGTTHYSLNPDGTFNLGNGAIKYDGKGQVTIGDNVVIKWNAPTDFKVEYAISKGTTKPSDGWSTVMPTNIAQGTYLWTRTTYPNGNVAYDVNYIGIDGTSVSIEKVEYAVSEDGNKNPSSGWSTTMPTDIAQGKYLWTRTTYNDGNQVFTSSYWANDGTTVSNVQYYVDSQGTTAPSDSANWQNAFPVIEKGKYIWTRTLYSDGTKAYTVSYLGKDGESISGESALIIDIDNDADGLAVDANSLVVNAIRCATKVTMFYGTTQESITSISTKAYTDSGCSIAATQTIDITSDKSTGIVNVSIPKGQYFTTNIYIKITASCSLGTRTIVFTLLRNNSGKNGVSPTIYSLSPDTTCISFKDGTTSETIGLKLYIKKSYENTTERIDSLSGFNIYYAFQGETTYKQAHIGDVLAVTYENSLSYKYMILELWEGERNKGKLHDIETIPILKDGKQGEPGVSAIDPSVYTIQCSSGCIVCTWTNGRWVYSPNPLLGIKAFVTTGLSTREYTEGEIAYALYRDNETTAYDNGIISSKMLLLKDYIKVTRIELSLSVNNAIVAQKSIAVSFNGKDGTNGKNGTDGKDGISTHNNLLPHTDFMPPASAYGGTLLNFRSDKATLATGAAMVANAATGGGDVLSCSASDITDLFKYDVTDLLQPSTWYVMAVTMRGSGSLTLYCYPNGHDTSTSMYADGEQAAANDDAHRTFDLTNVWRRHFVAFCTPSSLSDKVSFLARLGASSYAEIAYCTLGKPYGSASAQKAMGYIRHSTALMRMAYPNSDITFGGVNSLMAHRSSLVDIDMLLYNMASTLLAGEWYTLSFYAQGAGTIATHVYEIGGRVLSDDAADAPLADNTTDKTSSLGSHEWVLSSAWTRHTYTFRVRSDGSFTAPELLFRIPKGTTGQGIAISQVKLESGKYASDWCLNEMDREAVTLPEWMKAFNGVTMSGSNYIASGNAFFGRKETDGTYSGCFLSSDQLQIGGNKMLGFYALKNNTVMVAIDPIAQQYSFRGIVYATDGEFKGTVKADTGYFGGIVTGTVMNATTTIDATNINYYMQDVSGKGWVLRHDRIANIVYLDVNKWSNSLELKSFILNLIPYSTSAESTSQCLALLGKTFIIYHKGISLTLKGKLLAKGTTPTSSSVYKTSIDSIGTVVQLTLQIDSYGTFYWEYVAVTPSTSSGFTDVPAIKAPDGGASILSPDILPILPQNDEDEGDDADETI